MPLDKKAPPTHGEYTLLQSENYFYFVPKNSEFPDALEINKLTLDISLTSPQNIKDATPFKNVYLLVGILHLLGGPYLMVGVERRQVSKLEGQDIYEVSKFEVIPFMASTNHLSEAQYRENQVYLAMVRRVLDTPGFYYSNSYDLTHSLQRRAQRAEHTPNFSQLSLYERADERFAWNAHAMKDLAAQAELRRFMVPLVHGYVVIRTSSINGKSFTFCLISRRSTYRAGVRYFTRGIDYDGHVANYVETEQIIVYKNHTSSFVQTRGSIPLHWSQKPTLKYKPKPLVKPVNQVVHMQKHFDEQIVTYGQQVVIDLIDQKGSEKNLGDTFRSCIGQLSSCLVEYKAFDFHKECSKMRWYRLSILQDQVQEKQREFGYFMRAGDSVVTVQQGVFRTNCIDCLDRTNVVQSMLAKKSLHEQLQRMGVMSAEEKMEQKNQFNTIFMNTWADNADSCAKQYAGTGALKTDYTRTGKRTTRGLLQDGYNSIVRYFYNNFSDGFRQDSLDLFLGKYIINPWEGSHLQQRRSWRVTVVPISILFGLSMLFMSLIMPSTNPALQLVYILFWSGAVILTVAYLYNHGEEFVNEPKLVKAD